MQQLATEKQGLVREFDRQHQNLQEEIDSLKASVLALSQSLMRC